MSSAQNLFHVQMSTVRTTAEMTNLPAQDIGDRCIIETRDAGNAVTSQKLYELKAQPSSLLSNWAQIGGDGYTGGGSGGGSATWPVTGTPDVFPPEPHEHEFSEINSVPVLIAALAELVGNGVLEKTGSSTLATITTSIFGKTLLGMADASALRAALLVPSAAEALLKANNLSDLTDVPAARTALGLGAAALLAASGVGGVVTRGVDGKVPLIDLPDALIINDTFEAASQAAMLASAATKGDVCIRTDVNASYILAADPASTLANWKQLPAPASGVTSVFGSTGPNVTVTSLPTLSGVIADDDEIVILDKSGGAHARVTRANFLAGVGAILSVVGNAAKGIAVSTASGTATVSLQTNGLPSLVADFGSSSANFLVGKADGTPGQITADALLPALPARPTPASTDLVATSAAAGGIGKTTIAQVLTGRTLQSPTLVDQGEGKQVRVDVTGSYTLPTGTNTHHIRLIGNATVTLADVRPVTVGTWRGQTLIVDQDVTGGRTLTLQAPAGQTLNWTGGSAPSLDGAANGRTRYVFTYANGETRIDGIKSF